METKYEKFAALHRHPELFFLPNAWDAASAALLQEAGYGAVGTSSAAVAASLGYADGEQMPFAEYLMIIRRITPAVALPVTIDLEMGYGDTPSAIYKNVRAVTDAGAVGINLEDSVIRNGTRVLQKPAEFAATIAFIRKKLKEDRVDLFINVRSDTHLLGVEDKQRETMHRLGVYEAAGADGIFFPLIHAAADIAEAVAATTLPLNVMIFPSLPEPAKLKALGVKRVSMGPFLHTKTYAAAKAAATQMLTANSFDPIL